MTLSFDAGTWDTWLKRVEVVDKKLRAVPRDLRESASAQRVAEDAALDVCHRQLATSQKVRAFGTPFWAYDPVRRTLCCGPYTKRERDERAAMSAKFDEGTTVLTKAHAAAPPQLDKRRASGDYTRGKGLPAARGASALLPLAVPLDKYLLREATARDAGFLEVRDKSTPEEQARQEALNRQRERLLAKRADDRHRARQRALEEAKATKAAERSSLMAEVLGPASCVLPRHVSM